MQLGLALLFGYLALLCSRLETAWSVSPPQCLYFGGEIFSILIEIVPLRGNSLGKVPQNVVTS